jgi:autotransporter-associated beta strand protein
MRSIRHIVTYFVLCHFASVAWGHGFNISVDSYYDPVTLSVFSQAGYFDNDAVAVSPENMFIELFSGSLTSGTLGDYYSVLHGFCATAGSVPQYTATFNVVSPLYYSSGLPGGANPIGPVLAQPASPGTFLNVYDLWAGNPDPSTYPHPGAAFGNVLLTGATSYAPGFGVSLYDPHELEHDLYLSSTSTQTYGEYGFAYTVTMHFPGTNTTLTTVPLVDVYAISDPNLGDFPDNAAPALQDAASVSIFQAATRSKAPSWATASNGSWTSLANWANWPGNGIVGSPPTGPGVQVAIGAATTVPLSITLDKPQTIGALIFNNSASNTAGYTISGGSAGTLTLNNLTAGVQICITGGSNAISANTTLADNLWVAPDAGTTLVFSSNLTEASAGESLTLCGPGTLVLSGSNSYTGGTMVTEGTLEVLSSTAIPPGTSLMIGANATFIFDGTISSGSSADSVSSTNLSPVPEPATISLFLIGGIAMLFRRFYRHRTGFLLTLGFMSLWFQGCHHQVDPPDRSTTAASATIHLSQFAVEGMHCDDCAKSIASTLKDLPGVTSATVSFEQKKATVMADSKQVAASDIERKINAMGFHAKLLDGPDAAGATPSP